MKSWDEQNNAPVYSVDALKEQHMDLLLRLAFMRIEQERADSLQALVDENKAGISIEAMDEIYSKSKPKIARMIERETGKSRRKRFVRRTLPKITRIAAAILLTIYMGATVTFATVRSVRVYVPKFLINMEEQYAVLSLIKDEGAVLDVPIDWKGSWYPSYIPEDFSLSSVGKEGYKLFFTAQDGRMITFTEYDIDFTVQMDIEDSELQYLPLHGSVALMATKEDISLITWGNYDGFYLLRVDAIPEEAIKIAEEMKRIR